MQNIEHIIITQFSYRGVYANTMRGNDPLKKSNLEHRFKLFEMTCLPSILQQENQNFKWVLIVDPELKSHFRNKLEKLISGRANSYIHEFNPDEKQEHTGWLKPFINDKAAYLITTKLDDDDALFTGFTKAVHDHYYGLLENGKTPYFQFLGCNDNVIQWDFFWSEKAPLGYIKPWGRPNSLPSAAGYSLFVKYPEIDFTFFYQGHHKFKSLRAYIGNRTNREKVKNREQESFLKTIENAALQQKCNWNGQLSVAESFHIIEEPALQVVMVNHIENSQYKRIFEKPDDRIPVDEKTSFPGMAINFDLARANIYQQRKTLRFIIRALFRTIEFSHQGKTKLGFYSRIRRKYKMLVKTIRGIRKFG